MTVGIYRMTSGSTTYGWLCADDVKARKADGWSLEKLGEVDGDCQDCETRRQAAPGYRTPPAVDFVPTDPTRRHVPAPAPPKKKHAGKPGHLHYFDDGDEAAT